MSRYVPEFAKLQVFVGENPDGTMKTEPARRSITMRELMTHAGGLGDGLRAARGRLHQLDMSMFTTTGP